MVMGAGLDWILGVAHWVSGLDGARRTVISPGPWVLPLIALGGLIVILWQGRLRVVGAGAGRGGFCLWLGARAAGCADCRYGRDRGRHDR
jgi:competence protein ComEC